MKLETQTPLLWDKAIRWLAIWLNHKKIPLATATLTGFLAYMFAFTNKYMSHDEVQGLFSKGGAAESGRWVLNLIDAVFPNLSMPWIYGVISILFIAVGVSLMVSIFEIQNKLLQGLLAGCVVVFPSLISVMSYMFTSTVYTMAFFLAVVGVWMVTRWNKWWFLAGCACMVLSLATYQGFVALSASLLVIFLIQKLMRGDDLSAVIRQGFISLGFLILSLGIYYLSTKVVNWYLGLSMSSYATDRIQFDLLEIPEKTVTAYRFFLESLLDHRHGLVPSSFSRLLHLICLICCIGMVVLWFLNDKQKEWGRCALLVVLLLLVPLAINCMYLFTSVDAIHTLVLYSFVGVYVLSVVLADMQLQVSLPRVKAAVSSLCVHLLPLCMALVIAANIYIANAAYLNLHLRYEIAHSFYTSLIADIKMMPEFTPETKLAVIGYYQDPDFYEANFAPLKEIMGVRGFRPSSYSKARFLEYYLDFPMPMATDAEIAQIQSTAEFQKMPLYPYYGSMKLFGDTIVVKLS